MAIKVGIQLYSVRESMKEDPVGTIRKVLDCGYKYLEAANHNALEDQGVGFGIEAGELKKILDDAGSRIISAHIYPFDEEQYRSVMEYNLIIGNKNIIYPMDNFTDLDDLLRRCELLCRLGELTRQNGLHFLYHNHCHEFMTFGGKTVMDILMENVPEEFLGLELDTFWAMRGGMDPVELMKQYGGRIRLLHQKDLSTNSKVPVSVFETLPREASVENPVLFSNHRALVPDTDFVEIGTGRMDIQGIINAANEIGSTEYIILEQDKTQMNELESIRASMAAFRKLEGVDWR